MTEFEQNSNHHIPSLFIQRRYANSCTQACIKINFIIFEISDSGGREYEDDNILGYSAVYSR
jgi:hypothetical protein